MEKKDKKFRYPMFSCRLNQELQELIKADYEQSGKSWNLYFEDMFKFYKRKK